MSKKISVISIFLLFFVILLSCIKIYELEELSRQFVVQAITGHKNNVKKYVFKKALFTEDRAVWDFKAKFKSINKVKIKYKGYRAVLEDGYEIHRIWLTLYYKSIKTYITISFVREKCCWKVYKYKIGAPPDEW